MIVVRNGEGLRATRCRHCGAAIVWAVTSNDRRMPIDVEPSDAGLWVLWHYDEEEPDPVYHVTWWRDFAPPAGATPPRWAAHWGSCPARDAANAATAKHVAAGGARQLGLFEVLDGGKP